MCFVEVTDEKLDLPVMNPTEQNPLAMDSEMSTERKFQEMGRPLQLVSVDPTQNDSK